MSPDASAQQQEWYRAGLRFECTQCGNCCSGPAGYVLVSDEEASAFAAHLEISVAQFLARYTHTVPEGRSLIERKTDHGLDCIFLDRTSRPGKAVCSAYKVRPIQCRTWPFWPSMLKSAAAWERGKKTCPGLDKGRQHDLVQIRVQRDAIKI
jgi:Fe-S-cluster containining protein